MNHLDVQVLNSFTRKLAYAAEKMAAGRRPFVWDESDSARAAAGVARNNAGARLVPDITPKSRPYSAPADAKGGDSSPPLPGSAVSAGTSQAAADGLGGASPAGNSIGVGATASGDPAAPMPGVQKGPTAAGLSSSPVSEVPFPESGTPIYRNATMAATPQNPTGDSASVDPRFDLGRFLGEYGDDIGVAGAGGLGAMALARLFNSSKDDEEENSWWPWLAGLGGAGAAYGAWNYGPQLAQALAGMTGMGGGGADAPLQLNAPDGSPVSAPAAK